MGGGTFSTRPFQSDVWESGLLSELRNPTDGNVTQHAGNKRLARNDKDRRRVRCCVVSFLERYLGNKRTARRVCNLRIAFVRCQVDMAWKEHGDFF